MQKQNPFRLPIKPKWLARLVEKTLSLSVLANIYDTMPDTMPKDEQDSTSALGFLQHGIKALNLSFDVKNADALNSIPKEGPLVIIANHPLGGLEGIAMSEKLLKLRPDLKVLTNKILATIPELSDLFIGVDVMSDNAAKSNAKGIRKASKHLSTGGALLVYPAGKVSEMDRKTGNVEDRQWNTLVGSLLLRYQANCLPCFISGKNSDLFYKAGFIHQRLRTLLLPRELS